MAAAKAPDGHTIALNIDPFAEAVLADSHAHHAALRDAGPVARFEGELVLEARLSPTKSIKLTGPPVRPLNKTPHA